MLPHKDYVLPEILLDPDEGSESWHASPKPARRRWSGLEPGFWHDYWRDCIVVPWMETVADYEANPDNAFYAWCYLDTHPVFWKFDKNKEGYPEFHIGRLRYEGIMLEGWPWITPHMVCPETNEIEDDPELNTRLRWWYEFGPWMLYPDDYGIYSTHDYELDGGADTYEQAVIDVARKVWENYGNDRQVVDSEQWRKGGGGEQETV